MKVARLHTLKNKTNKLRKYFKFVLHKLALNEWIQCYKNKAR